MADSLAELSSRLFVGPVWPASILICLLVIYTIISLIGLVDFGFDAPEVETGDWQIDFDADLLGGLGATAIRWTNFGRIPIVIWGGLFAVVFWGISYWFWHTFDSQRYEPNWIPSILLSIRNVVIAAGINKAITQPMVGYFVDPPSYDENHLMGCTCEITTSEATPEFGQAKFRTNAAPLLLNIRTDGAHIPKGTEVRIVGFDKRTRVYTVTNLPLESQP